MNRRLIGERITTLLSHYWTADEPAELRALQMGDWLDDLGEFPAAIVADACKRWRQEQTKRPLPADIRRLSAEAQNREREVAERQKFAALPKPTRVVVDRSRQYAEAERAREAWARAHGCSSFTQAMAMGLASVGRNVAKPATEASAAPASEEIA